MSGYRRVASGEWITAPKRNHWVRCCDCGLVHIFNYKVIKGQIHIRVTRHNRATAQSPKRKKLKKVLASIG